MTYEVNTRSGAEVLATSEDIRCLGKRDQCREGKNKIGAIYYPGIDSKEGMTMSKHLSHKERVKMQEEAATRGVTLGFEDQCLGIWANGVTFSPTLRKTHLGFDLIYKTQKWFSLRSIGLIYNIFLFLI